MSCKGATKEAIRNTLKRTCDTSKYKGASNNLYYLKKQLLKVSQNYVLNLSLHLCNLVEIKNEKLFHALILFNHHRPLKVHFNCIQSLLTHQYFKTLLYLGQCRALDVFDCAQLLGQLLSHL